MNNFFKLKRTLDEIRRLGVSFDVPISSNINANNGYLETTRFDWDKFVSICLQFRKFYQHKDDVYYEKVRDLFPGKKELVSKIFEEFKIKAGIQIGMSYGNRSLETAKSDEMMELLLYGGTIHDYNERLCYFFDRMDDITKNLMIGCVLMSIQRICVNLNYLIVNK